MSTHIEMAHMNRFDRIDAPQESTLGYAAICFSWFCDVVNTVGFAKQQLGFCSRDYKDIHRSGTVVSELWANVAAFHKVRDGLVMIAGSQNLCQGW